MKFQLKTTLFLISLFFVTGAFAQSGAKFILTGVSANKDYLGTTGNYTGYEVRLAGRLGARAWYFSPGLAYQNTNLLPMEGRNPFEKTPRLHTLKVPVAIGLKYLTTPFQRIFAKVGLVGNYVLIIDENDIYDFEHINDTYASVFINAGYDIGKLTIEYRYEQSIMNNFADLRGSKTSSHAIGIGLNF